MKCKNCGTEFIQPRADTVYCGKKCRDIAYKKRKRDAVEVKQRGIDLVGQRFGRLTVAERTKERKNTFVVYRCICDCGNEKVSNTGALRSGATKSCGCLENENRKSINANFHKKTTKHSGWGTPTYSTWRAMKSRCADPSNKDYGGKGIKVCAEWESSFEAFLSDMGHRPPGASIDRIDGSLGYEKSNCRWVVPKSQCRNRSNNVYVSFGGAVLTMAEYAEILNVSWSGANKKARREGIYIGRMLPGGVFVKE